jgi:hypothetical protein
MGAAGDPLTLELREVATRSHRRDAVLLLEGRDTEMLPSSRNCAAISWRRSSGSMASALFTSRSFPTPGPGHPVPSERGGAR